MDKNTIRNQTGDFLNRIQNKSLAFRLQSQDKFYTSAVDISGSTTLINENKSLTGVIPALLPMKIATVRVSQVNGKETLERIEFTLLVNPETWNHGRTFSSQMSYTRSGWVVQLWGPNQDTISSTGKTAAFMTPAIGLDNFTSEMSFSYLNFLSLVSAYRNNGYYLEDFLSVDEITRVIKTVQGVQLMYDNDSYMGHFNSFTVDEVEETPYLLNYNFEFVISTLTDTETEIRGHYKQIPQSMTDLETGTAKDINTLVLTNDVYVKGASRKTAVPRPTDDRTTIRLWETITGLPWSEAFNLRLTDGSVNGNLLLRGQLLSKKWDPNQKKFVDKN